MGLMRWDDSPHWKAKDQPATAVEEPEEPAEPEFIEPELPVLVTPHTKKEITEAILDDSRYNATNPSNQQHIIDIAIAKARASGMLIEELGNEEDETDG